MMQTPEDVSEVGQYVLGKTTKKMKFRASYKCVVVFITSLTKSNCKIIAGIKCCQSSCKSLVSVTVGMTDFISLIYKLNTVESVLGNFRFCLVFFVFCYIQTIPFSCGHWTCLHLHYHT